MVEQIVQIHEAFAAVTAHKGIRITCKRMREVEIGVILVHENGTIKVCKAHCEDIVLMCFMLSLPLDEVNVNRVKPIHLTY